MVRTQAPPRPAGSSVAAVGRKVVVGVAGHTRGWASRGYGDASSARTLAWAIGEAAATGAQLVVVHATGPYGGSVPTPQPAGGESPRASGGLDGRGGLGALETVDRTAAGAVAAARARLGESWVRIVIDAGAPGEVLVREAGPRDVLVIGGPPRSGWWVRSGTTSFVVPRACCPVIVVHEPDWRYGTDPPGHDDTTDPDRAAARIASMLRGHVLVGLDGSDGSVLQYGLAYADSHGLPLVVARVVPQGGGAWFGEGVQPRADEPAAAAELTAELASWHRRYAQVPVSRAVLTGDAARALRRAGAHAALLVIGAGGTPLHPLGVVCRSLVANANCPVAVVH